MEVFLRVLTANLSFVTHLTSNLPGRTRYLLPSFSIILFLFNKMNAVPVIPIPIFGNMGLGTLYQWHENAYHPLNLYANQIESNPLAMEDGYMAGPWVGLVHDLFHTYAMNLLSVENRDFIFDQCVPVIKRLQERSHQWKHLTLAPGNELYDMNYRLENTIERLYDFNLTPACEYEDNDNDKVLNRFLRFCLVGTYPHESSEQDLIYTIHE